MKKTMVLLSAFVSMSASTSMAFVNMPTTRLQASAKYLSFILDEGAVVETLVKKNSATDITKIEIMGAMNKYKIHTDKCSLVAEVKTTEKQTLKQGGNKVVKSVDEVVVSAVTCKAASAVAAKASIVKMPRTRLEASADYLSFILSEGQVVDALINEHSATDIMSVKNLGAMNKFRISTSKCSVDVESNMEEKPVLKPGGGKKTGWQQEVKILDVKCK